MFLSILAVVLFLLFLNHVWFDGFTRSPFFFGGGGGGGGLKYINLMWIGFLFTKLLCMKLQTLRWVLC